MKTGAIPQWISLTRIGGHRQVDDSILILRHLGILRSSPSSSASSSYGLLGSILFYSPCGNPPQPKSLRVLVRRPQTLRQSIPTRACCIFQSLIHKLRRPRFWPGAVSGRVGAWTGDRNPETWTGPCRNDASFSPCSMTHTPPRHAQSTQTRLPR